MTEAGDTSAEEGYGSVVGRTTVNGSLGAAAVLIVTGCGGSTAAQGSADGSTQEGSVHVVADATAVADATGAVVLLPDGGLDGARSLVTCLSSADCPPQQVCCGNEDLIDHESPFIPESLCQPWHSLSDMDFRSSPLCPPGLPSQLCRSTAECVPSDFACALSSLPLAGMSVMTCIPPEEAGAAIEGCDAASYDDGGSGTCAPHWLNGNGCTGGYVLFPCGLPPPPTNTAKTCAPYCLGTSLQFCMALVDGGGVNQFPWVVDAGAVPTEVFCYNVSE